MMTISIYIQRDLNDYIINVKCIHDEMSTANEYENHHAEMKNNPCRTSSFISVIIITTLFAFARKIQSTSSLDVQLIAMQIKQMEMIV